MFVAKRIPVSDETTSVDWSNEDGMLALGLKSGGVRLMKLEGEKLDVVMDEMLRGHSSQAQRVLWNRRHSKLASVGASGEIIIWSSRKPSKVPPPGQRTSTAQLQLKSQTASGAAGWREEMVNHRKNCEVVDLSWDRAGNRIAILHSDTTVVIGSVEGKKVWGKEMKSKFTHVQWSPDGMNLVFAIDKELHLYDAMGNFIQSRQFDAEGNIVCLAWYDGSLGFPDVQAPCLVVGFESLTLVLSEFSDEMPIRIGTSTSSKQGYSWNSDGTMLIQLSAGSDQLNLFDAWGTVLRSLTLPVGQQVVAVSWNSESTHVVIAAGLNLYFLRVLEQRKWSYIPTSDDQGVVAFHHSRFDQTEHILSVWNTSNHQVFHKSMTRILLMESTFDVFTILLKSNGQYILYTVNTIGHSVNSTTLPAQGPLIPSHIQMTPNIVVLVFGSSLIYFWVHPLGKSKSVARLESLRDRIFHIDSGDPSTSVSADPIVSLALSDELLICFRKSGLVQSFKLPDLTPANTLQLPPGFLPNKASFNMDQTRIALLDAFGTLKLLSLETKDTPRLLEFTRKDTSHVVWSLDDPLALVTLEKTRLYIIRDQDPEEPISAIEPSSPQLKRTWYPVKFTQMQIKMCRIEMAFDAPGQISEGSSDPETPLIKTQGARLMRDLEQVLQVGLSDAFGFVSTHPHPALWNRVGMDALTQGQTGVAKQCFKQSKFVVGLEFCNRLSEIMNPASNVDSAVCEAMVCAFKGEYGRAIELFQYANRHDMVLKLLEYRGDDAQIARLLEFNPSTYDTKLRESSKRMADSMSSNGRVDEAAQLYTKAGYFDLACRCWFKLDRYDKVISLMRQCLLNKSDDSWIGPACDMLLRAGMAYEVTLVYMERDDFNRVLECCIESGRVPDFVLEYISGRAANDEMSTRLTNFVETVHVEHICGDSDEGNDHLATDAAMELVRWLRLLRHTCQPAFSILLMRILVALESKLETTNTPVRDLSLMKRVMQEAGNDDTINILDDLVGVYTQFRLIYSNSDKATEVVLENLAHVTRRVMLSKLTSARIRRDLLRMLTVQNTPSDAELALLIQSQYPVTNLGNL